MHQAENLCCFQVRSLWTSVSKILSSLEEERVVVDSVVKGDVDQYVLDGTDRVLRIPRRLLEQIENSCQTVRDVVGLRVIS